MSKKGNCVQADKKKEETRNEEDGGKGGRKERKGEYENMKG